MTLAGAPLFGLSNEPGGVLVEAIAEDALNISWSISEVCKHDDITRCCLTFDIVFVAFHQVLLMTSFDRTLLVVRDDDEVLLSQQMAVSPYRVAGLRPATVYNVTLTFVFVGGFEGTPVSVSATTEEGGEQES